MNNSDEKSVSGNERRAATRHEISLSSSVLITASSGSADAKEPYLFLQGQLLDVSRSGLALIISTDDMRELQMLGSDPLLRLLLPLPTKAIELEASPVRFEHQEDENAEVSVLMGAHITNMSSRDRILFMKFINDYEIPEN